MFEGFSKAFVRDAINRSAENAVDRRRFLRAAGLTGLGAAGVMGGGLALSGSAFAHDKEGDDDGAVTDAAILNFALNLEYLEAEFYLRAIGKTLDEDEISGKEKVGGVSGGREVKFETDLIRQYAVEIANDERDHVNFLRTALGGAAVSRPEISLDGALAAAAAAAGLGDGFDAFANENNFLLAAFVFEDVGVTAYKGAARLISNPDTLEAAAGLLAVEAYHAGIIRTVLASRVEQLGAASNAISNLRDAVDSSTDVDQGVLNDDGSVNVVPTDDNGLAFSRSAADVLNIVYLTPEAATEGGFFPAGVNGPINASDGFV